MLTRLDDASLDDQGDLYDLSEGEEVDGEEEEEVDGEEEEEEEGDEEKDDDDEISIASENATLDREIKRLMDEVSGSQ